MNRTRTARAAIVTAAAGLALVGCTRGTAPRTTIGAETTLPALASDTTGLSPATGRSLDGHDRSHWATHRVDVGPDGSRAWFWRTHMRARHGGEHPTALTSLNATSDYTARDLIGGHVRAAGEGIFLPFRSGRVILTEEADELATPYQRYRAGAWRTEE